ncbi:MAG: hypothetical protein FJX63_03835 [Alphaproteobacteria bacterium]|nr:hypothetical protein [Alphaproteobacteria bacterium]
MNKSRFSIPLYAILIPLLPAAQIYSSNVSRLTLTHGLLSAAAMLALFLVPLFVLRAIFRRAELTDLLWASLFSLVFLPMCFLPLEEPFFRVYWTLGWTIAILVIAFWRESRRFIPIFLTTMPALLIAPLLYADVTSPIWQQRPVLRDQFQHAFDETPKPTSDAAEKPDIYYLIFDRYARADQLARVYGYDNSAFIAGLRQRGFYVADNSYSNYQRTTHSIVSSLNFDYLDRLDTKEAANAEDWVPLYEMMGDFRIGRFLKEVGYELHFSGSWWEPTRRIPIADVHHNFYEMPELLRVVYEYSLLVDIARLAGWRQGDPLWWQCQRSRLMFGELGKAAAGNQPMFYYAHFLIPHPPYVTDETGRCMEIDEALGRSRIQNYTGQMTYTNDEILAAVDRILARPGPRAIIILQADEGPWPEQFASNEIIALGRDAGLVDWFEASADELREKTAILNALYMPKAPAEIFSPDMTPVNTFRHVLKHYFNVSIEPLPDRSLIFESAENLYHFKDVTENLRGP